MSDTFPSADLVPRRDFTGVPQRTEHRAKLLDDALPGEKPGLELGLALSVDGEVPVTSPGKPAYDTYTVLVSTEPVRIVGDDIARTRLTVTTITDPTTPVPLAIGHYAALYAGNGGAILPPNVPVELNTTDEVYAVISQLLGNVASTQSAWLSVIIERSR